MLARSTRRKFIAGAAGAAVGSISGCAVSPVPTGRLRVEGFTGRVVQRGEPVYERWREGMVWQMRKPERYPEVILRPNHHADVQAAVRFAKQNGLRVAVRSGGHNIWAAAVREGGVLIDLSGFRQFSTESGENTVRLGPSLWARDVMAALEPQGTALPVAHCATVPMGGYALGGGFGLNGDEWGAMACYCIVGGKVVTADGDLLTVNEREHRDLLWAMRGGGGAIPGIVTELDMKTFDRPGAVRSGTYVFPLASMDLAIELLGEIVELRPRHTELLALMAHNPQAGDDAPPDVRKMIVVRTQVYASQVQAGRILEDIANLPAAKLAAFSLPDGVESFEKLFVEGMDWRRGFGFGRFAVENAWVASRVRAIGDIAEEFLRTPSWKSHIVIQPKLADATAPGGAFSVASDTYVGLYGIWDEPEDDARNLAWLRRMRDRLDAHAVGHYVNEIDAAADTQRLKRSFSDEAWARLRELRANWDPDGVFHDFPGLS